MTATLEVIYWRDIPAQVIARRGRDAFRVELPERFQEAIDRAAMRAGKAGTDDYLEEWRKERTPCEEDLEAAARQEAEKLQSAFTDAVLARFIANQGRMA